MIQINRHAISLCQIAPLRVVVGLMKRLGLLRLVVVAVLREVLSDHPEEVVGVLLDHPEVVVVELVVLLVVVGTLVLLADL